MRIQNSLKTITIIVVAALWPLSSLTAKKIYVGAGEPGSDWGILKTEVGPQSASVLVDGEFVGHADEFNQAGQGIYVKPGEHEVTLSLVYYKDYTVEVSVAAGETKVIEHNLAASDEQRPKRPLGKVKFPCGDTCRASLKVNGRYIGHVDEMNGPFQRMVVEPGRYEIVIELEGYQTKREMLEIEPGTKHIVDARLSPVSDAFAE